MYILCNEVLVLTKLNIVKIVIIIAMKPTSPSPLPYLNQSLIFNRNVAK